ncbi:MAG: sialidase family protein [Burkholderiales bacterium]
MIFLRLAPTSWQVEAPPAKISAPNSAAKYFSANLSTTEPSNHASSVLALPDGTRMVVWFAGSREGATDVKLMLAINENEHWSETQAIQSVAGNATAFGHHTKKIGNPLLFAADGKIHLLFVTVALGGWGGSRIAHSVSVDKGRTWSAPQLWVTSPFINISTQLRNPPLPVKLDDGSMGWLLPVHHEFMRKFPEYLLLDNGGNFLHKQRVPYGNGLIQPALIAYPQGGAGAQLQAYFRPTAEQKKILTASYKNNWDATLQTTSLPNPDAGIALVKLADQRLLMAYNPSSENRNRLALALSDNGSTWRTVTEIENAKDNEFSYPALAVRGDDIDLTYSYRRQFIKHARFNTAWLDQQLSAQKE